MKSTTTILGCLLLLFISCLSQAQSYKIVKTQHVAKTANYGALVWQNPEEMYVNDGTVSTVSVALNASESDLTEEIVITGMAFNISPTSTITGISVDMERMATGLSGGATVMDEDFFLVKAGTILTAESRASATPWQSSLTVESHGGPADMWGEAWTPADVNDPDFGIAFSVAFNAGVSTVTMTASVDVITITIHHVDLPLPITLTSFSGENKDDHVALAWETQTETNSDYFQVERSTSASLEWEPLCLVKAAGTSFSLKQYMAVDPSPSEMNYYRLKQVDISNRVEYSPILFVDCSKENTALSVQPIPASDHIKVLSKKPGERLEIYSANGTFIEAYAEGGNSTSAEISIHHLDPGLYFLRAYDANSVRSVRFMKIK